MGNELARYKMEGPLRDILKANGTPLKSQTARAFLKEAGEIAPWFLEEGLLNVPQWEHLGEELRRSTTVTAGTLAVWSLVKVCLQSSRERLKQVVQQGGEILEQLKEESLGDSSRASDVEDNSSDESSDTPSPGTIKCPEKARKQVAFLYTIFQFCNNIVRHFNLRAPGGVLEKSPCFSSPFSSPQYHRTHALFILNSLQSILILDSYVYSVWKKEVFLHC